MQMQVNMLTCKQRAGLSPILLATSKSQTLSADWSAADWRSVLRKVIACPWADSQVIALILPYLSWSYSLQKKEGKNDKIHVLQYKVVQMSNTPWQCISFGSTECIAPVSPLKANHLKNKHELEKWEILQAFSWPIDVLCLWITAQQIKKME